MKKRLNILCVLILLVLGWSIVENSYYMLVGIRKSFELGYEYSEQIAANPQEADKSEIDRISNMVPISVIPHAFKNKDGNRWMADSVYNAKTDSYVPAMYYQMVVSIDMPHSVINRIGSFLLSMLYLLSSVWAIVLFIKWVLAVNRSDVFNWRNVRRLRFIGILMLVNTACSLLLSYIYMYSISDVFALEGYDMYVLGYISVLSLLLGLCSFIVAEVFAIGLRMKEEQDLTI